MNTEISDAKLAANRANALKSTGPRTPAGKAVSSRNAVTHGFYQQDHILPGEFQEEFDLLYTDYYQRLQPVDGLECQLVTNMVMLEWQLRRMRITENCLVQMALNRQDPTGPNDGYFRIAQAFEENVAKGTIQAANRVLTRMSRELNAMLRNFYLIRKNSPLPLQPPEIADVQEEVRNEPKPASEPSTEETCNPNEKRDLVIDQVPPN